MWRRGLVWALGTGGYTGQHYDPTMGEIFSAEFGVRRPDLFLGAGSGPTRRRHAGDGGLRSAPGPSRHPMWSWSAA
jgi:hypothetical protein